MRTKRRFSLLIVMVMFFVFSSFGAVSAAPVSFETAQIVAENWMKRIGESKIVNEGIVLQNEGERIGYLFDFSGGGFVVVPMDDIFEPIKAWSREGSFRGDPSRAMDMETMVKKSFLQQKRFLSNRRTSADYQNNLEVHQGWEQILAPGKIRVQGSSQAIGPLLTTKWGQGTPYSNYCPLDGEFHSSTGCVNTAIVQIMRYWRWPLTGFGKKCYTDSFDERYNCGTGQKICASFEHSYDWVNMTDVYSENSSQDEIDAVAELMADVGALSETCYSFGSSYGSLGAIVADFSIYFGYSDEIGEIFEHRDNFSPIVQSQIDKLYPVFFVSDNHAYVADGYRVDLGMDQIHFNFGWNGDSDGWFTTEGLDDFWNYSTGGDNSVYMLINIHPDVPTLQEPPSPPELTVTTSGITVSCSWPAVADVDGYLLSYAFTIDPSSIASINLGTTQTSLSADLWVGASYSVAVQACNAYGCSGYSNIEPFIIH